MTSSSMILALRLAALALLLSIAACATFRAPPTVTFVVVRHAEKLDDGTRDPPLSEAGKARAHRLADALQSAPLVAVYATGYQRTRQTAAPTALVHGLPVSTYDAKASAADVASMLRQAHQAGQVLVVGHSNTAPAIAAALCGCEVAPMDESEYTRRMTVQIGADGSVTLVTAATP